MRVIGAPFVCPIDGDALRETAAALVCARSHTFDRSADGYVNLLLVQHKASRNPGDDRAMVAARRRTLDAGFFQSVADRVCAMVHATVELTVPHGPVRILDAGCGEGYYLRRFVEEAEALDCERTFEVAGTDISKWAVRAAAKRTRVVAWAVATNAQLPFADTSTQLILSLFGHPAWGSFKRVLVSGGHVLLADPGPDHLIELRSIGYPTVERGGVPSLEHAHSLGFESLQEERTSYQVDLTSQTQIATMLAMTPHVHRMPAAGRAALAEVQHQRVTIDVVFRLLRKTEGHGGSSRSAR